MRVFVIASGDTATGLQAALAPHCEVQATADARLIRDFAQGGPVHVILIDAALPGPGAMTVAQALHQALPSSALLLVEAEVVSTPPPPPFHSRVRFPLDSRMLLAKMVRTWRAMQAGASDTRELQAEIEVHSINLEGLSYYELLGVPKDAGRDRITSAYDTLSLRFHPDRLRNLSPEFQERGRELYLRIGDAYRTLRSPGLRTRYDHNLDGDGDPTAELDTSETLTTLESLSRVAAVRKYLGLARQALVSGNGQMAIIQMRFALSLEPQNTLIAHKLSELEQQYG